MMLVKAMRNPFRMECFSSCSATRTSFCVCCVYAANSSSKMVVRRRMYSASTSSNARIRSYSYAEVFRSKKLYGKHLIRLPSGSNATPSSWCTSHTSFLSSKISMRRHSPSTVSVGSVGDAVLWCALQHSTIFDSSFFCGASCESLRAM